jgi:energy-coupling factor transporter ATP-binding protein EcfA2
MYEIGPFQYYFKKSSEKKISCNEKICISKGELVLLTGPSGGGKSTFLQMLKGIVPEFSTGTFEGQILYEGHALFGEFFQKNLKKILFLFQNPFTQLIYPKAADEFFFSMENENYSREEMDRKKQELQKYFDLDSLWDKKTKDLSHGECQRLVLASLLAVDPEVLLLDEPTAFLDPEARASFYLWLSSHKGKKTVIVVDHHFDEIIPYVNQVIEVSSEGEVSQKMTSFQVSKNMGPSLTALFDEQQKSNVIEFSISNISFHHLNQKKLLENITLSAGAGDVIVIKGKNGQGKSTLFKIMGGLLRPLKGEVKIISNEGPIAKNRQKKEIGFIFQNPETHFFYDTIREELNNIPHDQLHSLLMKFFTKVDVERSPFLLSEGEKRRLSILMTVFQKKNILFYDEPTFGQDRDSIDLIRDMIVELKSLGKIQFIISHDEEFIDSLNPRVYLLRNQTLEKIQ